jgi:hypothetical protein
MKISFATFILVSSLSLFGCSSSSSGGGSSEPVNASINSANAKSLATAATEGAKMAGDSDNASQFSFRSASRNKIEELSESLAREYALIPTNVPDICTTGGVSIDTLPNGDNILDYQLCEIGGATADGQVVLNIDVDGDITTISLSYVNFSVTIDADTTVIDSSAVCVTNTTTLSVSCTYSSDIAGIDGRTYSISGLSVSGDSIAGYSVSATINDPDYGLITISTLNPVLLDCTNGQPSTGDIQFTDADGVLVTITFNDCSSFTVTYDGVATMYNW